MSVRENRSVHPFDTEMFVRARDRSLVLVLVLFRPPEDHKVIVHISKSLLLNETEAVKMHKIRGSQMQFTNRSRRATSAASYVRPRRPRRAPGRRAPVKSRRRLSGPRPVSALVVAQHVGLRTRTGAR